MTLRNNKSHNLLNVHAVLSVSYANGPGARAVIWVQGCSRKCPGCSNPLTYSHKPRILVDPEQLADSILAIPGIEGITVSGGEPFEQPVVAGHLCRAVRKAGLSIMLFSGWKYEDICQHHDQGVQTLLKQIDILVDGPFIRHLADKHLLWRGSRNQQIRFLTNRYSPDVLQKNNQLQVEGQLAPGVPLQITGFPQESDMAVLTERLAIEAGILLEPSEIVKSQNTERGGKYDD